MIRNERVRLRHYVIQRRSPRVVLVGLGHFDRLEAQLARPVVALVNRAAQGRRRAEAPLRLVVAARAPLGTEPRRSPPAHRSEHLKNGRASGRESEYSQSER